MFSFWKKIVGGRTRNSIRHAVRLEFLEKRELFAADAAIGIFNNGTWQLEGQAAEISFGLPGDQPVMGDWNGNGKKTPGVFRNGTWVLDVTGNGYDSQDRVVHFGLPGDKAVSGDWNGNGLDTVGVYRNGQWFFDKDGNGYDAADGLPISFGLPGDIPVPGDWDGDGRDTPGVFRDGTWVLDNTGNGYDHGDRVLQFGLPGAQPLAADWNGDGKDSPAVLQHGQWFFDLEEDGFTGEIGRANILGSGIAVTGSRVAANEPSITGLVHQLSRGDVLTETISIAGESDRFQFHAQGGEVFQLSLHTSNPSNVLSVRVFRPDGTPLGGTIVVSGVSQTPFSVPSQLSGSFRIEVRAKNGTSTGQYRIGLESLSTPSPNAVPIAPGNILTGTLREPIQVDQFRVQGRSGERIQLRIAGLSPAMGPLKVTVYKPGGSSKLGDVTVNSSRAIEFWVNTHEAGTYLIQVQASGGLSTGQYRLQMLTLTPVHAANAILLRSGTSRTESISEPVQSKQFLIDVLPNRRIELQMTRLSGSPNFRPKITLVNSSGNVVSSFVVRNGMRSISIPTHEGMGSRMLVQIEDSGLAATGTVHLKYQLRSR